MAVAAVGVEHREHERTDLADTDSSSSGNVVVVVVAVVD